MTVLNKSLWRGSHCSAMSKWPVEDTGRNSVTPSIIPSRTAVNKSCTGRLDDKTAAMTRGKCGWGLKDESVGCLDSWVLYSKYPNTQITKCLRLLPSEQRGEKSLSFKLALLDLELAEQRLPGHENFMPLVFDAPQHVFVLFA